MFEKMSEVKFFAKNKVVGYSNNNDFLKNMRFFANECGLHRMSNAKNAKNGRLKR